MCDLIFETAWRPAYQLPTPCARSSDRLAGQNRPSAGAWDEVAAPQREAGRAVGLLTAGELEAYVRMEQALVVVVRGKRCVSCQAVRYCCVSCQRQVWPAHRRACKELARQRAEAQG
jgi:hypothetical protein